MIHPNFDAFWIKISGHLPLEEMDPSHSHVSTVMKLRTASGIVTAFSPQSSDPDSWCAADNFILVAGSQK